MSSIPMRSPTPPLDSSSDDLNELSLDQELAQCQRPHFLDHTEIGIPYPVDIMPPPIPPRNAMLSSLPLPPHRSTIPSKMVRSAENAMQSPTECLPTGKKHFLDENPIPPDYEYDATQRPSSKEHKDDNSAINDNRSKLKRNREPSYALSRYLEKDDDGCRSFASGEVHLNDVRLTSNAESSSQPKISADCVYSLMIGCNSPVEMSRRFLELSKSPSTCAALRHSRYIPWLVQMIHCEADELTKQQASEALRNVVNYLPDDKVGRREKKVLRYIELIMEYCNLLRRSLTDDSLSAEAQDHNNHPLKAMCSLMTISFDQEHRHAMCQLGALQIIASLVHYDHAVHGVNSSNADCISLRRYAGMALTNLTFGDGNNKALLCANRDFMKALVAQIHTDADDLLQVTANVLRNLSWRADNDMKMVLNEIGTVTALTLAAMRNRNETTLKAILSALWNLSAHCSKNKLELCQVNGALLFLVEMLTYDAPSKKPSIKENAGGILRNVSSHIAVNENFRKILRQRNCLGILLKQLKSESLTIVSNACGTLWNLSSRCPEDQKFLLDNGAVPMLRSLIHSKHKMISDGSKVALKNLVNFRPGDLNRSGLDPVAKMMGLKELPTLSARKQRALEGVLNEKLPESCDTVETTKPLSHSINQEAPKSLTGIERNLKYVAHDFGHLSLQDSGGNSSFDESPSNGVVRSESWQMTFSAPTGGTQDTNTQSSVPHSTGTIPKRTANKTNIDDNETKVVEPDDQIINYSLLYSENHPESRDAKATQETFNEQDTVKCYASEGTPMLSTATSLTDLRPFARGANQSHNLLRQSISGRTTTDNSGIITPERHYYTEDCSSCHSRRDSYGSAQCDHDEQRTNGGYAQKSMQLIDAHKSNVGAQHIEQMQPINEIDGAHASTTPSSSVECASKTVTFNEFNLETPMMFSRHSSLGSLGPHEAGMNDEIASVVSEISQPSGLISPSEIPDSPSQSMPQSPKQRRVAPAPYRRIQPVGAADEVKTFNVENTPAHISCATSLSNLSFDDEPKVSDDGLVKEMHLMHQVSQEKCDSPSAAPAQSNGAPEEQSNVGTVAVPKTEHIDAESSDSDDSIEDAEMDSQLLENCINAGIQAVTRSQIAVPDIKSPPALPKPADVLDDDSSDEEINDDLLEQCIQSGISSATVKPHPLPPTKPIATQAMLRDNPIGMFRKGGAPLLSMNFEVTKPFNMEGSPRTFSIISGLSDLTVGSQKAGLLKDNGQSTNQNAEKDANDNRPSSPSSVDSNEDDDLILAQAIADGMQAKTSSLTQPPNRSVQPLIDTLPVSNANATTNYDSNDSISSIDDECNANELLQQCIQAGIAKAKAPLQPTTHNGNAMKMPPNSVGPIRRSQLPTPRATTSSSHRSRSKIRHPYDGQPSIGCNEKPSKQNTHSNLIHGRNMDGRMPSKGSGMIEPSKQSSHENSKNFPATSANVSRTAGAPGVVMSRTTGTDHCAPDLHLRDDVSVQTMSSSKNDQDQNIATVGDIHETTAAQIPNETGCSLNASTLDASTTSIKSRNSFGGEIPLLEQSNEYPALFTQTECLSDSQHSASVDMEISNECLFDTNSSMSPIKMDKHKDPNLMLQSVERLTQELVSQAEYLRTANSLEDDDDDVTITETKSHIQSCSNDTWNEDTHVVSFPSISQSAPIIAKNSDLTFSEPDVDAKDCANDMESVRDVSLNNNNKGICFEIGGEVSQTNYIDSNYFGRESFDTTSSAMTNSTIITMEANKIHAQLMESHDCKNDSTLSLDKIRPPSAMERMNNSLYCDSLNGISSAKNSPARCFPAGIMARRAIQSNHQGSMDSINSNCTLLDRVKPPSLMDDLLDSMISLDSIKTEFVDVKSHLPDETSHYETAMSECDDLTQTLKCCADLPFDDTPCGSDFSSVESTPKKGRRSLTPRRRRQMAKERYQTYTIPDGEAAIAQDTLKQQNADVDNNPKSLLENDTISLVSAADDDLSSIRALTRNFVYLQDMDEFNDDNSLAHNDHSINTNTFTKHSRAFMQHDFQSSPMHSGDYYDSLPMDEACFSNESNSTICSGSKSPRIVKPNEHASVDGPLANGKSLDGSPANEPRAIRGRKKPAYVSPYAMAKLTKVTPPTAPVTTATKPTTTPTVTAKNPPSKLFTPKPSQAKVAPVEQREKPKSFIQRSAESLKKIRPSFTSKLSKTLPKKSDKQTLDRQKSTESAKSDHLLIRQNTFTKDEPSEGEVPVIASEPASPAKTKSLVSRIPFNRTVSLQSSRNVVKCKTNIEIPAQRSSAASITRRILKSASSASQIVSPPSVTPKTMLSPRSSIDSPSTSKSLFKKWSPTLKSTISSPIPANAAAKAKVSTAREPIASIPLKKPTVSGLKPTLTAKPSKIATSRIISTNGKTMKI